MDLNKWKRFKRSGHYKRKIQKTYQEMVKGTRSDLGLVEVQVTKPGEGSAQNNSIFDYDSNTEETFCVNSSSGSETDVEEHTSDSNKNNELRENIKKWALLFNIPHAAINSLLEILNKRTNNALPKDARTLLHTNKENLSLSVSAPGQYWHNGLIKCLTTINYFLNVCPSDEIFLNVNVDGLPVFRSSRYQFWPILCNIYEVPVAPFVVGIYAGEGKPSDLEAFLGPFVSEMTLLEENGLKITTNSKTEKLLCVKLRAFICDSPARAMIKGVANFNSKHGCLKCTVVGEYSHRSNTVTFIATDSPKRNDKDFRSKSYGQHHKCDSPLLKLNVDMVEDFPVSDSLHLIDLGLMKRLLIGWRDGNFGTYLTKWSARDIHEVNNFLLECHLPEEIHRSVRSLDVLAHWKGSEFRTFFYYLSFIILREILRTEPFNNFMHLFCAITICSNEKHFQFLRIAEQMLIYFVKKFQNIYGKDYVTSNIHNLLHLVEEVRKYGILQNFNAYPFENKLYSIKKMVRQGNKALQQVAHRINERALTDVDRLLEKNQNYPMIKKTKRGEPGGVLHLETFVLSSKKQDKWFLSNENKVVEFIKVNESQEQTIEIHGYYIENTEDAFEEPLKSSFLNIYKCDKRQLKKLESVFKTTDIKCKLVSIQLHTNLFFIPLLHTL